MPPRAVMIMSGAVPHRSFDGCRTWFMGLVFPSEAVARRWNGALQARLRRAPLEAFLRARSLSPAPRGVAQDSDDVARATVLIVEAGLSFYLAGRPEGLAFRQ